MVHTGQPCSQSERMIMANEEKQIMPEVQAYLAARGEAEKAELATRGKLAEKYPQRYGWTEEAIKQREAWHDAVGAAHRVRQVTTNEAWNKLKGSDEPLVRWIAEGWCHIWVQFREQAVEDGVIVGPKPSMPEIRAILDWVDGASCCALTGRQRRELSEKLDALVAEAKAEATSGVAA